jgi:uncharacterized cupin superfamily protein|tara:strand:+ start:3297 stop:3746 length:450 start_codon:yes stop_codon:yes gene_type:complete
MKFFLSVQLIATIFFCSIASAEGSMNNKKITQLDPTDLETVELSAVEDHSYIKVVDGDKPIAGGLTSFQSGDGKLDVGFYHGSKVTLRINGWPVDEVMVFLEGQVEIINEDSTSKIYGPGDMLVMPKGFVGIWRQLGPIKKANISYQGQ